MLLPPFRSKSLWLALVAAALLAVPALGNGFQTPVPTPTPTNSFTNTPTAVPTPKPDRKVTICHKRKTITVSSHALYAHLAHYDTRGACKIRKTYRRYFWDLWRGGDWRQPTRW